MTKKNWNSSARFRQDGISEPESRPIELRQRDIEQSIFDCQGSSNGPAARPARDPGVAPNGGPVRRPPQARIINVRTEQFGPAELFSRAYAVSDRGDKPGTLRNPLAPFRGRKHRKAMSHNGKEPKPVLPKAPQPPLSHRGATPDSERARRPPLAESHATDQELNPGDRVEGLGDFGKPTGKFGTVEQANEDDAVVKWDGDGRMRLGQPRLKKV
jgi:hypothetical protein